MENKKDTLKFEILLIFALGIISVSFLLLYSTATSPLTLFFGADSAFFTLVGRGMKEGMLPYVDFFDMKGPYLFFVEYLGQLICPGKTGIFILQCINLCLCLYVTVKIYRSALGDKVDRSFKEVLKILLFGVAPVLLLSAITFEYGNLTEEFSLPLLLLVLKFTLSYFKACDGGEHHHPVTYGFYYGATFGILALIRITNAALIGAAILTVTVELLIKKKYRNLFANAVAFLLGVLTAVTPAAIFLASKGALGDMLEQVFVFGFVYSGELSFLSKLITLFLTKKELILLMLAPVVVLIFAKKDRKYWVFSGSAFLLLLVAAAMGNGYFHYFTLGIPNLVLGIALLLEHTDLLFLKRNTKNKILAGIFAFLLLLQIPAALRMSKTCVYQCLQLDGSDIEYQQIRQIRDAIPEEDQNSVYVYGLSSCSSWYVRAELLPPNPYCDWQEHYMQLDPDIEHAIAEYLSSGEARWLVISRANGIENERIRDIVEKRYTVYMKNDRYVLYAVIE